MSGYSSFATIVLSQTDLHNLFYSLATLGEIALPAPSNTIAFSPDGTMLAISYDNPDFWGPNHVTVWTVP